MLYADNALNFMREKFDNPAFPYNYTLGDITANKVEVRVYSGSLSVMTWFDVEKQLFGFDMIQGGFKTYDSIDGFISYFTTYMEIYTELIPVSKLIMKSFEAYSGITTIYDTFTGNKKSGYVTHFRVVGNADEGIAIMKHGGVYDLIRLHKTADMATPEAESYYRYKVENGTVTNIITESVVFDQLGKRYSSDTVKRINKNSFEVSYASHTYLTSILIADGKLAYEIDMFDGNPVEVVLDSLSDFYDLEEVTLELLTAVNKINKRENSMDVEAEVVENAVTNESSTDESVLDFNSEESTKSDTVSVLDESATESVVDMGSCDESASEETAEATTDEASLEGSIEESSLESETTVEKEFNDEFMDESTEASDNISEEKSLDEFNEETVKDFATAEELDPLADSSIEEQASEIDNAVNEEESVTGSDAIPEESVVTAVETVEPEVAEATPEPEVSDTTVETVESEVAETTPEPEVSDTTVIEASSENKNVESANEPDNTPTFKLKLEKSSNGDVISLHFVFNDAIYVISGTKAESLGIPVDRVQAGVVQRTNSALPMTEDEARLKVFAKDVSSDDEKCSELFDLLFS